MTEEELKELEALIASSTPGPWSRDDDCGPDWDAVLAPSEEPDVDILVCKANRYDHGVRDRVEADMRLIAAARSVIPTLIAALRTERRRADVAEARLEYAEAVKDAQWDTCSPSTRKQLDDCVAAAEAKLHALGVKT